MLTIINRAFVTILLLSIAGSIVGAAFLAVQRLLYRHTSAKFVFRLNRLAIIAFVIPAVYILGNLDQTNYYLLHNSILVLVEPGTLKSAFYALWEAIGFADKVTLLWLAGVGAYLLSCAASYAIFLRRVRESSRELESGVWQAQFHALCRDAGLGEGRIRLASSSWLGQACTAGMLRKTILVPDCLAEKLEEPEIRIVLSHELAHIRKNHVPVKVGMLLLCSLNWFNPLVYVLNRRLDEWIELSCDEEVLASATPASRHAYANTMLKVMAAQQAESPCHKSAAYFQCGQTAKCMQRRLEGIMESRTPKKAAQVLALAGLCCAMAYGTLLAKELDFRVNGIFSNHLEIVDQAEYSESSPPGELEGLGYDFTRFEGEAAETPFHPDADGDYEIVYPDGARHFLAGYAEAAQEHPHVFEDANLNKHEKQADGSCVTAVHAAGACTECGYIAYRDKTIASMMYYDCPHRILQAGR